MKIVKETSADYLHSHMYDFLEKSVLIKDRNVQDQATIVKTKVYKNLHSAFERKLSQVKEEKKDKGK